MKKVIILGAGGFIGSHLVKRLKFHGNFVVAVDLKLPEFEDTIADKFIVGDLRNLDFVKQVIGEDIDEIYQLAADMGGAGYVFTGDHDAAILHNSALINLHVAKIASERKVKKLFYASSACIYPEFNQMDPNNPLCSEDSAYPAQPDSEYGWEKLFSERLYLSFGKNEGLHVKIARFHNVYGPNGAWKNGKEKAPAALCRKVIEAEDGTEIEIWGDGLQTRSFLYIEDCLDAIEKLMDTEGFCGPVNIGSEEMISIQDFATMIIQLSGKKLSIVNVDGPTGVRGRCSDNRIVRQKLGWQPIWSLFDGISVTYKWIENQIRS